MKIAYIISAYRNPHQLVRLVNKLNSENCLFLVHVDKKTSQEVFDIVFCKLSHLENIYFLDRHACYWGDFGHVLATLKGIQVLCGKQIHFDYVILLTGQCYPIKSNQYISEFLQQNLGRSFIEYDLVNSYHQLKRLERWNIRLFSRSYIPIPNKFIRLPIKRPLSRRLGDFYKGSSYWIISKTCIDYIYKYMNSNISENIQFIKFFKGVYIPDELFFQTLLVNSPLKDTLVNQSLWYIDWPAGVYVPSPSVLNQSYFHELTASDKLFARKFDATQSPKILDMLDQFTEQ